MKDKPSKRYLFTSRCTKTLDKLQKEITEGVTNSVSAGNTPVTIAG